MTGKSKSEIDAIVDAIVNDEDTARALKSRLHEDDPEQTSEAAVRRAAPVQAPAADRGDDADLWDNLPV
ncbi:hypothetical protein [Celeribacter sp.]|uniref:hypothetical protein n=1 Tax=Celeribacter sp. TaxID=1890673 RepID=UPI003A948F3D